jgi:internalin A
VPYDDLLLWESEGRARYSVPAAGRILDLNVQDLLNGVDLEATRRKKSGIDTKKRTVRLFISYSHKDEDARDELETHLKLLQRQNIIDAWRRAPTTLRQPPFEFSVAPPLSQTRNR